MFVLQQLNTLGFSSQRSYVCLIINKQIINKHIFKINKSHLLFVLQKNKPNVFNCCQQAPLTPPAIPLVVRFGQPLRQVLHSYMDRAEDGVFTVWLADEPLAALAGRPLRRFSGVSKWPETEQFADMLPPTWGTTRSTFTEKGWLRATLRARGVADQIQLQ